MIGSSSNSNPKIGKYYGKHSFVKRCDVTHTPVRLRNARHAACSFGSYTVLQVAVKICLVWFISVVIAAPLFILSRHDRSTLLKDGMCFPNDKTFIVASSIGSFYIPLLIMIVTYSVTIHLLNSRASKHKNGIKPKSYISKQKAGEKFREAGEESSMIMYERESGSGCKSPLGVLQRDNSDEKEDTVDLTVQKKLNSATNTCDSLSLSHSNQASGEDSPIRSSLDKSNSYEHGILKLPISRSATTELELSATVESSSADCHLPATKGKSHQCKLSIRDIPESGFVHHDENEEGEEEPEPSWKRKSPTTPSSTTPLTTSLSTHSALHAVTHNNHVVSHKKRSNERKDSKLSDSKLVYIATMRNRNERKASQTLGIIFSVFMVLWCPFFISYVVQAVCEPCRPLITDEMMVAFTWLGYCSSMVNPFIYSMFSRNFRTAFTKILTCRFRDLKDIKGTSLYMSTTYA